MTLEEMQRSVHANARAHGFWEGCYVPEHAPRLDQFRNLAEVPLVRAEVLKQIPEKVALLHSEVTEILEAYREHPDKCDRDDLFYVGDEWRTREQTVVSPPKPAGIREELADIIIRCGDLAEALGIDLSKAVRQKMDYNATRPFKHGKTC